MQELMKAKAVPGVPRSQSLAWLGGLGTAEVETLRCLCPRRCQHQLFPGSRLLGLPCPASCQAARLDEYG